MEELCISVQDFSFNSRLYLAITRLQFYRVTVTFSFLGGCSHGGAALFQVYFILSFVAAFLGLGSHPRFDVCSLVSACINDRLEQKYIRTFQMKFELHLNLMTQGTCDIIHLLAYLLILNDVVITQRKTLKYGAFEGF